MGGQLRFLFGKHSGAMAIEAVLNRHKEELTAAGVEVTPRLVQLLLRLVKEVREKKAMVSQHRDGVRNYYSHLERLGLTEEDLLAYALVLGRDAKEPPQSPLAATTRARSEPEPREPAGPDPRPARPLAGRAR